MFDADTITVYQAFKPEIAGPAARDGRFGAGFSLDRMTWIKPSFLWMMHRSGWASKPGQERVLSIRITRDGFDWALRNAVLSRFHGNVHASEPEWRVELTRRPVRVQWDPERDLRGTALPWRSLQVGLQGEAARRYAGEWIRAIADATPLAHRIRDLVAAGRPGEATALLPDERPYDLREPAVRHALRLTP